MIGQTICRLAKEKILEVFDVDRVSVVDDGFVKDYPSNSKITMLHLAIPVMAVIVVYAAFLLLHMFDDKITINFNYTNGKKTIYIKQYLSFFYKKGHFKLSELKSVLLKI